MYTESDDVEGTFTPYSLSLFLLTLQDRLLALPMVTGELVYKFRKITDRNDFSDQFWKIIIRNKRTGYSMQGRIQRVSVRGCGRGWGGEGVGWAHPM